MRRLAVILVFSCLGCATTSLDFTPTREAPRPLRARSAEQVEVFMNAPPERAHVEVGVVEVQQEPGSTVQSAEMIAQLRTLAAEHGCDGLANFSNNDSVSETMWVPGGASRKYEMSGFRASCIVYLADSAPQPSAKPTPAQSPVPAQPPVPVQSPAPAQPPACVPNATQLCFGPGGCRGGQSCTADGRGWSPCDCGTAPPSPAAEH